MRNPPVMVVLHKNQCKGNMIKFTWQNTVNVNNSLKYSDVRGKTQYFLMYESYCVFPQIINLNAIMFCDKGQ